MSSVILPVFFTESFGCKTICIFYSKITRIKSYNKLLKAFKEWNRFRQIFACTA